MNRIPYVYRIKRKDTGEFYYGSKYGSNADPNKFWVSYFTSSKTIKKIIEFYGADIFHCKIVKIFNSDEKHLAFNLEKKLIDKTIKSKKSLNGHSGGTCHDTNKGRKVKNPVTNLSDYDLMGINRSKYLKEHPEFIKKITEKRKQTLSVNPEILESAKRKFKLTLDTVKTNGLTLREELSLRVIGDKNPSKIDENKKKISDGTKQWYIENPELAKDLRLKIKNGMLKKDTTGKNAHERHSEWMKENNPTANTVWVNDGNINLRVNENFIPDGFTRGRVPFIIKRNERTCPHCDKVGYGPNMTRYHFNNCKKKEQT